MARTYALSFHLAARAVGRLARRRATSVLLIGLISFVLSASFALLVRMPQPLIHDEFSYLLAGVLAIGAAGMAYYNCRVTGNVLRLPYMVHEATYTMAPIFLYQDPRPEPNYRHAAMRDFHRSYLQD